MTTMTYSTTLKLKRRNFTFTNRLSKKTPRPSGALRRRRRCHSARPPDQPAPCGECLSIAQTRTTPSRSLIVATGPPFHSDHHSTCAVVLACCEGDLVPSLTSTSRVCPFSPISRSGHPSPTRCSNVTEQPCARKARTTSRWFASTLQALTFFPEVFTHSKTMTP